MSPLRRAPLAAALALAAAAPAAAQRAAAPVAPAARRAPDAAVATYQIDAAHSELSFRIRHLLGRVSGGFGEWGGAIAVDSANPSNSRVDVTITTASIDTKNARRDSHLRSAEFFAADSFPAITFRSTRVETQGKALRVHGELTMRGRTRPVVLVGEYAGAFRDAAGKQRTAFTASTTINRNDFGVAWNRAVESGAMLGDDVTIDVAVEAVRQ
jgi:polyisoprenoid-binding protein YceI